MQLLAGRESTLARRRRGSEAMALPSTLAPTAGLRSNSKRSRGIMFSFKGLRPFATSCHNDRQSMPCHTTSDNQNTGFFNMAWRSYNAMVNVPGLLILDSRDDSAYAAGHVKGSVCVQVAGESLEFVMGPGPWSRNCWWGKDVLVVPRAWRGGGARKRKASELVVDPVAKVLMKEGLVKSLKVMEDDEGMDPFCSFAKKYPFLVTKSLKGVKILSYPAEIVPRLLYLGDIDHAKSASILKDLRISYVLTVHTEPLKSHEGCTHLFFDLADEPNADISQYFEQAFNFVEEARRLKKRVLLHCGAGASRSATLCAYYLMRVNEWNVDETLKFLREQRKQVQPNAGFLSALESYERQMNSSSLPTEPSMKELVLEVHKNGEVVSSISTDEKTDLVFGRLTTCDIVLDHASISRKHARLLWSGNSLSLLDLGSVHGTFVNNMLVSKETKHELSIGDVVTFGASSRKYVVRGL